MNINYYTALQKTSWQQLLPNEDITNSHRSLRFSKFFDPKSVVPRITRTKLTIYTIGEDLAAKLFYTDILQRYATGRFNYVIEHRHRLCHSCCNKEMSKQLAPMHDIPCLAVFGVRKFRKVANATDIIKCNYPRCKNMIVGDESCRFDEPDVRMYYTTHMEGKGYLPLGPRIDSWASFQRIQRDPLFYVIPASKRKYAFNAIFSLTSRSRKGLARLLDAYITKLPIYKMISEEFSLNADDPNTPQLHSEEYMKVALDSTFTLAPAGHNPECYRLYEAVEAGSIPILLRGEMQAWGNLGGKCRGSLSEWIDAPLVVLDSWDELYPRVRELLSDPKALDEMQINLRLWYDAHMSRVVSNFEDFMIMSYPKGVGKVNATYS